MPSNTRSHHSYRIDLLSFFLSSSNRYRFDFFFISSSICLSLIIEIEDRKEEKKIYLYKRMIFRMVLIRFFLFALCHQIYTHTFQVSFIVVEKKKYLISIYQCRHMNYRKREENTFCFTTFSLSRFDF